MAQLWVITLIPHFSAQRLQIDSFNFSHQFSLDKWSCQRRHIPAHSYTHTHKQMHTIHHNDPCAISPMLKYARHVNGAEQAVLSKNRVSSVHYEGGRRTVKTAFTQIYFILLFSPSSPLSSPVLQISCTSFSLSPLCEHNSLWFGFLTCVQIGKLQDGELSLVRFMWSPGAFGRWGVWEVLVVGVGESEGRGH